MNLNELLPAGSLDALAAQLGVPREEAQRGAEALLPLLLGGMGDAAGGLDLPDAGGLQAQLYGLGGEALADNVVGPDPTQAEKGNEVLGRIFGSKDTSRQVAGHAAQTSGLDPELLKRMLPILAMLVAGYLSSRSKGQQGGLAGILGSVLGSLAGGGSPASSLPGGGSLGGLGGILGSILGGGRR